MREVDDAEIKQYTYAVFQVMRVFFIVPKGA